MQLCLLCTPDTSVPRLASALVRRPLRKFAVSSTRRGPAQFRCDLDSEPQRQRGARSQRQSSASSAPPVRDPQRQGSVPSAPPVRVPPPPPPPPPPVQEQEGPSRRTILALITGGTIATYGARKSLDPKIYHDKYGVHYLKTGNGNQVAIGTDKDTGNIMMVDPAGNLYYDTGDQKLGIYMVSKKGDLFNMYTDTNNEQQTSLLGNVADLRSIKVKDIGGIPIETLQAHYAIQRDRQGKKDDGMPNSIIGFPDDRQVQLPPDTVKVYTTGKNKVELQGPPVLDEGAIYLEDKQNWWPFMEKGGGKLQRGSG